MGDLVFGVGYPATPEDMSSSILDGFRLEQDEAHHDMLTLDYRRFPASSTGLGAGAPVLANYGRNTTKQWVGYVHHVTPHQSEQRLSATVTALGASMLLQEPRQEVWPPSTVAEIVMEIGRRNRLFVVTDVDVVLRKQTTQPGVSDWNVLTRLAAEHGAMLHCDGTTIRFMARTQDTPKARAEALVFAYRRDGTTEIFDFQPTIGLSNTGSQDEANVLVLTGVDPRTARTVRTVRGAANGRLMRKKTIDPLFTVYAPEVVVHSPEEADERADALQNTYKWNHTATASLRGDVRLRPGVLVFLSDIPGQLGGYWSVTSVVHEWRGGVYRCAVSLGTDSVGGTREVYGDVRIGDTVRYVDPLGSTEERVAVPPTILRQAVETLSPGEVVPFRSAAVRWAAQYQPPRQVPLPSLPAALKNQRIARG